MQVSYNNTVYSCSTACHDPSRIPPFIRAQPVETCRKIEKCLLLGKQAGSNKMTGSCVQTRWKNKTCLICCKLLYGFSAALRKYSMVKWNYKTNKPPETLYQTYTRDMLLSLRYAGFHLWPTRCYQTSAREAQKAAVERQTRGGGGVGGG